MAHLDLSQTLFPDWKPLTYPTWIERSTLPHRDFFRRRWHYMQNVAKQAQADGLDHLTPILLALGEPPKTARKLVGKANWKQLHRGSQTSNASRASIYLSWSHKLTWADILCIRACHLATFRRISPTVDWDRLQQLLYVGRVAPPGAWNNVAMLYQDTERMGKPVNTRWSLNRLQREHDTLAAKSLARTTSATPWANGFHLEVDGFVFDRLCSDRDLTVEGQSQRHCVASYSNDARRGVIVIMKIEGAERATFAFDAQTGATADLKGWANSRVSAKCRKAAIAAKFKWRRTQ